MAAATAPRPRLASAVRWTWLAASSFAEAALVLGFVLLIWLAIWMSLSRARFAAEHEAEETTASLAHAYADSAKRLVEGVDQILLALRSAYAADPDGFDLDSWLRLQNPPDRLRVQVSIVDPSGFLRLSNLMSNGTRIDLSDRAHFRAQLDPSRDALFVSQPVVGRVSGVQTIQFTRKLLRRDGRFGGVGVVSVGCEELSRFYQSAQEAGFVLLAGDDGIVRARGPFRADQIGMDLHGAALFPQLAAVRGSIPHAVSRNGRKQMLGFEHLDGYPLLVVVGTDEERAFHAWRDTRDRWVAIGLIVTVAVALLGAFWIRQRQHFATSQQALRLTLDSMSQGLIMVDARGQIPVMNQQAADLLGLPADLAEAGGTAESLRAMASAQALEPGVLRRGETCIEVLRRAMPDGGAVLTYSDVTERQRYENHILTLAHHDGLTGLANRLLLAERIDAAAQEAASNGTCVGLITLDLDRFKTVNDSLGHEVGDTVLIEVARRLECAVRGSDTVARVGGDEFVVVLAGMTDPDAAERVAHDVLNTLSAPMRVGERTLNIGASAGTAVYPFDGGDQKSLIHNADIALYKAKADGRGLLRRFDTVMGRALEERRWLEGELRAGLARGYLEVFYQPQFTPDTLAISGFEALARWRHPERGLIQPDRFIPIAEECGLITTMGEVVLEEACAFAAGLPRACRVAVNLSPVQFRATELPELIAQVLRRTGLPASLLELEITEGVLIQDEEQALRMLDALRALDVRIALDDFGTGYSSLSYLRRFPFDRVKVDRSFVEAEQEDERTAAILDAVLTMGSRLRLAVTVEGVETAAQLQMVRRCGVTEVQGFLLGRPMPASDALRFFAQSMSAPKGPALVVAASDGVLTAAGESFG